MHHNNNETVATIRMLTNLKKTLSSLSVAGGASSAKLLPAATTYLSEWGLRSTC